MQPLQYYLQDTAAEDNNSITHAAAAPSNLDAATTMRSADTELRNTIELRALKRLKNMQQRQQQQQKQKQVELLFQAPQNGSAARDFLRLSPASLTVDLLLSYPTMTRFPHCRATNSGPKQLSHFTGLFD